MGHSWAARVKKEYWEGDRSHGTQTQQNKADKEIKTAENVFCSNLEAAGISEELHDAYEEFCESLQPEFGQRNGFSIVCHTDHKKNYPKFDPVFLLFK